MTQIEVRSENSDRSIGELFGRLASETGTLVRQEVRLAVVETRQNLKAVVAASVWLASGLAVTVVSVLVLIAALILLLSIWLPAWLGATIVGVTLGTGGAIVASHGWSTLKGAELTPEDSIKSIKEDAEWLKEQI
jgi:uncharacterized membrane protein YqjE